MIKFKDYLEEQIQTFTECHSRLLSNTTEEDIHKLRTTLKKLKSFNILLDEILGNKDFPVELRTLFKSAGEIRDIQVQQKILEQYEDSYKTYLLYLYQEKIANFKIKDSYRGEIEHLRFKLSKIMQMSLGDEEKIKSAMQFYVIRIRDKIKEMCYNVSKENLHDVRIKIKRIYYTLLMLEEFEEAEKLNKIQETIGLWHDYDVTIINIKNFDNNLKIIKSLKRKRAALYKEALKLVKF
jgi:CHAD domain-containing protein